MRAEYRATERSDAQNAAFAARLAERLEDRRGRLVWQRAAVTAAVAVAVLLFLLNSALREEDHDMGMPQLAQTQVVPGVEFHGLEVESIPGADAVEGALLALAHATAYEDAGPDEDNPSDFDESLPNDYLAISSLFLGG